MSVRNANYSSPVRVNREEYMELSIEGMQKATYENSLRTSLVSPIERWPIKKYTNWLKNGKQFLARFQIFMRIAVFSGYFSRAHVSKNKGQNAYICARNKWRLFGPTLQLIFINSRIKTGPVSRPRRFSYRFAPRKNRKPLRGPTYVICGRFPVSCGFLIDSSGDRGNLITTHDASILPK